LIHQKGGYLLSGGDYEELTDLQWRAIPHMVVLIAALENGTYETEYLKGGKGGEVEMTIEEFTALQLGGKTAPKSKEEVAKRYKLDPVTEEQKARWERIKAKYNAVN
jgi:hypothetical protein